jgi:hypothetical protein
MLLGEMVDENTDIGKLVGRFVFSKSDWCVYVVERADEVTLKYLDFFGRWDGRKFSIEPQEQDMTTHTWNTTHSRISEFWYLRPECIWRQACTDKQ